MKIKLVLGVVAAVAMGVVSQASLADRDEHRGGGGRDVAVVDNKLYLDECGACHFAYQPGLLPERSWRELMVNLKDHFGEDAGLDADDRQVLTDYLLKNAGDHSNYRHSKKLMRSLHRSDTPLRISAIPYFVKEHGEIPSRVFANKKVKSISNCNNCHRRAETGSYAEREINIPGYGHWDD